MALWRGWLRLRLVALVSLTIAANASLFEDQRGSNNWITEFVGGITDAKVLQREPFAVLTSDKGLLASVALRNGTLIWRRQHSTSILEVSEENGVVITAHASGVLHAWQLSGGQLLWRASTTSTVKAVCLSKNAVHVVTAQHILSLHITRGDTIWQEGALGHEVGIAQCWADDQRLHVSTVSEDRSSIVLIRYHIVNGMKDAEVAARSTIKLSPTALAVTGQVIVAASQDEKRICARQIFSKANDTTLQCTLLPEGVAGPVDVQADGAIAVVMQAGHSSASLALVDVGNSSPTIKKVMADVAAASAPFLMLDGRSAVAVVHRLDGDQSLRISLVALLTGSVLSSEIARDYPAVDAAGAILQAARVWATHAPTQSEPVLRYLIQARDKSLIYAQRSRVLWQRHEALADTVSSLFLDLPPRGNPHAPLEQPHLSILDHVNLNFLVLKGQLGLSSHQELGMLATLRAQASHRFDGTRDKLGMRKLILAATTDSGLYALHSADGRILWHSRLESGGLPLKGLHVYRVPRSVHENIEVVAIYSDTVRAAASIVDAYSGAILWYGQLRGPVSHVQEVNSPSDAPATFLLAALPPQGAHSQAFIFPQNVRPPLDEGKLFFWAADKDSGTVTGYTVGALSEAGTAPLVQAWSVGLPGTILATQPRTPSPATALVKVQGDRSMRFRYLNPCTALLVSGSTTDDESKSSVLSIMIIDTVSGRILHQQTHNGARGPVATALFDHVGVVQFWDVQALRWHVAVMELYDHSVPPMSTGKMISGVLGGSLSVPRNVSSYQPIKLEVLRQSFFSRAAVRTMVPTSTLHSVTPKHLLVATESDQVYELDTRMIDARRPMVSKPSAAHKEERLVPYSPQLPLIPTSFATYDLQPLGIKALHSAPTALESTTYVFAHGLDLYCALLRPAHGFDLLDDDFSFAALLAALLVLLGGVVFMALTVREAKLKAKWQ